MKLNKEQYKKFQDELRTLGLNIDGKHITVNYLSNKHVSRYRTLITWMRKNEVPMKESTLNDLYKIDVVVRRKLSEILKPIEVEISSWIKYYFEFKSVKILDLYEGNLFEKIGSLPSKIRKSKISTKFFVDKTLISISKKKKTNDLNIIIDQMTFGQLVALLSLFKNEHIKEIFSEKEEKMTKQKIIEVLEHMVFLRNLSAHNSILFSATKLVCNKQEVNLPELMESLDSITREGYKERLKSELENYKRNAISKYAAQSDEREEDMKILFEIVIRELIGV